MGPARALFGSDGRPDKSRLKEARQEGKGAPSALGSESPRLEVSGHQAAAEAVPRSCHEFAQHEARTSQVDLGVPEPQEPWALRMKPGAQSESPAISDPVWGFLGGSTGDPRATSSPRRNARSSWRQLGAS